MENMDLKKKILGGLMSHMDNMASKKFGKKPDAVIVETETTDSTDPKTLAEEIFNIVSEGDLVKAAKISKIADLIKGCMDEGE